MPQPKHWPKDAFLDLKEQCADPAGARFVILPIPYEQTTTYQQGCALGPDAIIEASQQIELFDEQLFDEFYQAGIYTHPALDCAAATPEQAQRIIYKTARPLFTNGRVVLSLGGEHAISSALVQAAREDFTNLSVLHFDAHADLRDRYQNSAHNHACVMRRIHDLGVPFVSVGIRSYDREQYEFMQENDIKVITPEMARADRSGTLDQLLNQLSRQVYITFDIDAFDPACAPGTGTPEPGGLEYYEVLAILESIGRSKQIVGADIVEVMPLQGNHVTEFLAARLAYKIIAFSQLHNAE